jgi:Cof subfamily protein (haloacid dehalogenase superfamily)
VSNGIRLVLSDVDGTLVSPAKVLTPEAIDVVARLHEAGILFAVTSGRPPRGLTMLVEPLHLTTPLVGFNGGLVVNPDMSVLHELTIRDDVVPQVIEILNANALSIWVYQGTDWFVLDRDGPHVAHEATVTEFEPSQLASFDGLHGDIVKIVGVGDDPTKVASATTALDQQFASAVSATTSQTYYLDVTNRDANKGVVVDFLARHFGLVRSEIAVIGDAANDVLMFERAGLSIAMGNAANAVKAQATYVTSSNEDNGFAKGVEKYVLT